MSSKKWWILPGALISTFMVVHAADLKPDGSMPLSQLLQSVESRNLGSITEVELEHGLWEVEIQTGTQELTLYLEPDTGEVKRESSESKRKQKTPPADAQPLSEIVRTIEDRNMGKITEVEFDDGFWEFEVRDDAMKTKFDIDPRTGEDRAI